MRPRRASPEPGVPDSPAPTSDGSVNCCTAADTPPAVLCSTRSSESESWTLPGLSKDRAWGRMPQYMAVLPMCFCEFLSFAVLRAVLPGLQSKAFGGLSYAVEGATLAVQGTLAFLCCPVVGAVSDQFGRKLPLCICAVGTALPSMTALCTRSMHLYQMSVALSGVFKATFVVVFAYVADSVPPGPRRTSAYGLVLGTLGLSFTIGPGIGGAVALYFGTDATFLLCVTLGLSAASYARWVLPESLPAARPAPPGAAAKESAAPRPGPVRIDWAKANPFRVLRSVCDDPFLARLMTIAFLYYLSYWGLVPTVMLYVTRNFGFTPTESGRLLGLIGGCNMCAEVCLVRILLRCGVPERAMLRMGLAGWAAKCVIFGLAHERWLLYVAASMTLVTGLFSPALTALAAAAGGARGRQGEVQGAVSAFRALAEGGGPMLSGSLLVSFADSTRPGLPYVFVGCAAAAGLAASLALPAQDPAEAGREGRDDPGLLAGPRTAAVSRRRSPQRRTSGDPEDGASPLSQPSPRRSRAQQSPLSAQQGAPRPPDA